ncbi:hypothetical protein MUK42_35594 [Musa troglodytarum]|uniref:V-type proton ATPase proteolipid subunit n=1 Tax=Musa troglodytarum TaxID=320322 RepID=A0A9E7G8J4_9LILI|nr:hypothetical protein MUK42_35594 [Musa troglodytarum]
MGITPKAKSYYVFDGYAHLFSGLAGLSAGVAIGIVGDAGVRFLMWLPNDRSRSCCIEQGNAKDAC